MGPLNTCVVEQLYKRNITLVVDMAKYQHGFNSALASFTFSLLPLTFSSVFKFF